MTRSSRLFLFLIGAIALAALPSSTIAATAQPVSAEAQSLQLPETDEGLPGAGPIRRYDWFKKLWTERRTAWAGRVEKDQRALVFLGDSITQGWGDDVGGSFPEIGRAHV